MRQSLSVNQSFAGSASLACLLRESQCHLRSTATPTTQLSLGAGHLVLMLIQQMLYPWSHLPRSFFFVSRCIYFSLCVGFCMCIPRVCLLPEEARRRHWIPLNWSNRQLWAILWMVGSEPGKAASALNCWALNAHPPAASSSESIKLQPEHPQDNPFAGPLRHRQWHSGDTWSVSPEQESCDVSLLFLTFQIWPTEKDKQSYCNAKKKKYGTIVNHLLLPEDPERHLFSSNISHNNSWNL